MYKKILMVLCLPALAFFTSTPAFAQGRVCFDVPSCNVNKNAGRYYDSDCGPLRKLVIKRNVFGAPGFGAAPPTAGVIVSSFPYLAVNSAAVPIQFGTNTMDSASMDLISQQVANRLRADMRNLEMNRGMETQATTQATAPVPTRCDDPCGQILQLRTEVNQLNEVTKALADIVEKLAEKNQE